MSGSYKISLIIPVYKTEKTLIRCLDSCINAFLDYLHQVEIIVINDGSPGDPQSILTPYLTKYPNIKYYYQKNRGLSGARNKGISLSNGEYIWCIDSDDTISNDCAEYIMGILDRKLDVYTVGYSLVDNEGNLISEVRPDITIASGKELLLTYRQPMGAPFYIISKKYLEQDNLMFYEGIYHEDNLFNFQLLYKANSLAAIDVIAYNYYQYGSGTITSTPSLKRSKDLLLISEMLYEFLMSNSTTRGVRPYSGYIGLCLTSAYHNLKRCNIESRRFFFLQLKEKKTFLYKLLKIQRLKYVVFISYLLIQSFFYVKE